MKSSQTFYKMQSHQNIKKTDRYTEANINKEGNKHAREANIIGRIEISGTGNSFITLKSNKKKLKSSN